MILLKKIAEGSGKGRGGAVVKGLLKGIRFLGVVGLAGGIGISIYNVVNASGSQSGRVLSKEIGGWIVGIGASFIAASAVAALVTAGPLVIAGVAIAAGIGGSILGEKLGGWLYKQTN